jgi:hypothetical protein
MKNLSWGFLHIPPQGYLSARSPADNEGFRITC